MITKKRLSALLIILAMLSPQYYRSAESDTKSPTTQIDPNDFVSEVTNPYFPLEPGTTFIYEGESEGVPTREVVTVTNETKEILGVTTTVVHAEAYEDGVLIEDTFDWYAQDKEGNVWYFRNHGGIGEQQRISTGGSWEAAWMALNHHHAVNQRRANMTRFGIAGYGG
jgi:hypothetical protein